MLLNELISLLNQELDPGQMHDYCPNGLQVEGREQVNKLVTGVTASEALIDAAIEVNADAILVHHGYFWKGENPIIRGMKKTRLQKLLNHDISLIAYHLPIDVHMSLGNNRQLGQRLGLNNIQAYPGISPHGIVMYGEFSAAISKAELHKSIECQLSRQALMVGKDNIDTGICCLAWCTGGGQSYIDAVASGDVKVDAFLSGEISEQTTHSAIEQGLLYIAAGHHATERYGVKAVGEWLTKEHNLLTQFIDIDNPA